MEFRLANIDDLPKLKAVYRDIICNMNKENIKIWNEVYPCEIFCDDIANKCLYILVENKEILSAFALCNSNSGAESVKWKNEQKKVLYIDRFGVNINYLRKGIASIMIQKAKSISGNQGAEYLRLFVVDINKPAINLYIKNGFQKADGIYDEVIDDNIILHELGFEIETKI